MSDQQATTGVPEVGQPTVQSAQSASLTREQVETLVRQAEENAFRRAQGLFDKRLTKVQEQQNQLAGVLDLLKQSGVEVNPDTAAKIQQAAFQKAMTEPEPAPVTAPQSALATDDGDQLDPVTAIAVGFEKRYGVEISDNDPEARTIKSDGTPDEYIESYRDAILAKKARLQTSPQPNTLGRTPTNLTMGGAPAPERDMKNYRTYLSDSLRGK